MKETIFEDITNRIGKTDEGFIIEKTVKYSLNIFDNCNRCEKLNAMCDKLPKCHLCVREWRKEFDK